MEIEVRDLGLITYQDALVIQQSIVSDVLDGKRGGVLLLLEHSPVITLGAGFHAENLLRSIEDYKRDGIDVLPSNRGGDVTYHGPGQLVAYPIFNLSPIGKDLHRWLRSLEAAVISCLQEFGLRSERFPPHTGVWVEDRKICAMGIHVKRWVSMHGLALNCDVDLSPYRQIVPCGIADYSVTSISNELSRKVTVDKVKPVLTDAFVQEFSLKVN